MAGLLRSPLVLARSSLRASAVRACPPTLVRSFLINAKPTKSKPSKDSQINSKPIDPSLSSSSSSSEAASAAASSSVLPPTTEDKTSKYRTETPPPGVAAFAHRLGLNTLKDRSLWMRIITHPSYERVGIRTNEGLDFLGGKVMEMYVLEYFHVKYPKLPADTLQEVVQVYTRSATLDIMGKEFGVDDVARWVRSKPEAGHQLAVSTIRASVIRAIVGAIYVDQGPIKARDFVHAHFLSREFDLVSLLKIEDPKLYLSFLMKRLGRERPVSRMLAETGRQSKAPVFVVGVYSGTEKLGEGFGHSIVMAETRANKDALTKYYMEELKDFTLPSDVEKEGFIYTPTKVGDTQVVV